MQRLLPFPWGFSQHLYCNWEVPTGLSPPQGTFLLPSSAQGITEGNPGIPNLGGNIRISCEQLLENSDSRACSEACGLYMFRDSAGESGFSKSPQLILDSLPDIEGLGGPSLYGHLSFSAVLLNSVISMHLFPCSHLQHSASSRIISRVCQLLPTFTAPCHPLSQQHQHPGSEATELA